MRLKYKEALKAEVEAFSESIRERVSEGMRGSGLVNAAVEKWEQVVKKVARAVVVCGRAVRWWIKQKIEERREVYRMILRGQGDLREEYTKLHREVKSLVIEKKLALWNEVVETANVDLRKGFLAFVGRRT